MQRPPRRPSDVGPPPAASFAAPPRGLRAFPHAVSSAAAAAAAVIASDFQRGVGVAELLGGPSFAAPAAPSPEAEAGEPYRVPHDMLSSAGSSTESSGYTESSSKASLQSSESTHPRSRPTAISSLFFRGEREQLGSRPPPLRPAAPRLGPPRLAPLRPTPTVPRSSLDKGAIPRDKGLALRKPKKEARRAEIVAAVTKRLYTTKKKPEGSASEDTATPEPPPSVVEDDEAEPEELKLCARARAKLQELSRRVVGPGAGRRLRPVLVDADVQTDIPRPTTRVKEKAVATDPYVQRVADASVDTSDAPETRSVDVGVDTRQVPSDRVLCVRETAAGPDVSAPCTAPAGAATAAAAASVALPPRARPPPHPPPAKHLCSSACQSTGAEERVTSDSKCFDCFLQSTSEQIEDGPYVVGTKTKSNQCNLFDGLQECKQVSVGVIPHASTSCGAASYSHDGRMADYKDAAVGTEKCFYHTQLQKYVGITAVPAPSILIHTQNNDSFTSNNIPTYFTSLGRLSQLPIRDRVTNNIYEYVNKGDSTGPLSYFNTYRPLISHGDAYTMRKTLGTQTLGNKIGNSFLSCDTINRKHFGECPSNSYVPKQYKNFENQFSRTEQCCPIYPSHVLYKQMDECFSDDSLDSSKSVDQFAEPDSIHDIQSCEHFSQHNHSFLVKKERNVRKSHFSENNNCPVHNKSGYYPFHMKKGRHNTIRNMNERPHICRSSTHNNSISNAEPVHERCNLHKGNLTCEKQLRNVNSNRDLKESHGRKQDRTLVKINNPDSVPISTELNKLMEGTTPHTHITNIQITRQPQDDTVMSELNFPVQVSENNQNVQHNANDRSNTQLFALNETPFYTFSKSKSGYVAKEVTSFTLSPINYQLKETQFQYTQTVDEDKDYAPGKNDDLKESSTLNIPNEDKMPSNCLHVMPLFCSECNKKVTPITGGKNGGKNGKTKSVSDNAQIDNELVHINKTLCQFSEISQDNVSGKISKNDCLQLNENYSSLCQDTSSSSDVTESPMSSVRKKINSEFPCDMINDTFKENISSKNDLYSIIAYDQQFRQNTNENSLQKCINTMISQENKESQFENANTFHVGERKNSNNCSSSDILSTSLEQIKQCVQTIQNNLSKYYQTEIKTESMKNETPQEITTKWVFNQSQQENSMPQEEASQCKFETIITLNKSTNVLPNWNGLFKISNNSDAISSLEQNTVVEPNDENATSTMSTHNNKLPTSHTAENNNDDTSIKMEININDSQLKTGSVTFGKNFTSFDTEVQNFKLLLMMCGDLVDKSQSTALQNQTNGQQNKFPENAVIKFTFEDGGYQPLLNIIVQQSMFHNSLRNTSRPHENATQHVNQDNSVDSLNCSPSEICKQNGKDNDKNNAVPLLLEGETEKVINNSDDSHNFKEITPRSLQNQVQNVVENKKEMNLGDVINTQPTTQSHLTFLNHNHTLPDIKYRDIKQGTDGRVNSLNTSFFKKTIKKKKKCYPLTAPSCMWNFMERQTLSNDTKLGTSKTCSTISTFIRKANDLLTRLNEVTTILDKGKRKPDTEPLIPEEIFEHSDEDTFRYNPECDINTKCVATGDKLSAEKPIATISKNYRIASHEPITASENYLQFENPVSPLRAKFLPAQSESHKRVNVISSIETSHFNGNESLFLSDEYHSKSMNSSVYNLQPEKTNSRMMRISPIMDNSSTTVPQRTSKPQIVPSIPNTKYWTDRKLKRQTSQSHIYNISGYASHSENNTEIRNDNIQANKCSLNNTRSYCYNQNVCIKCKAREQKLHDEIEINGQYSFCHHHNVSLGTENSNAYSFQNIHSKYKRRVLDNVHSTTIHSTRNSKDHISREYNREHKSRDWFIDKMSSATQPSPELSRYQNHRPKLKYFTSLASRKLLTPIIPQHEKILKVPMPIHYTSVRKQYYIPDIRQAEQVRHDSLYNKNDSENNAIPINTLICETCVNRKKTNTNIEKPMNLTEGFRKRTHNKKRNILPLDGANYLSSFIASPRAYMQHLLQLRRQIVVASGLNSLKYTSKTTENFKS